MIMLNDAPFPHYSQPRALTRPSYHLPKPTSPSVSLCLFYPDPPDSNAACSFSGTRQEGALRELQQWLTIAAPLLDAVRALLIGQAAPRIPRIRPFTLGASAQLSELVIENFKN